MSEAVGNLSFYDSTGQSDMALTKPYSDLTAQQIDAEARLLIDRAYKMAEKVLREHADGLKQLAELLLDREVVFTEDVERIFGKRKKDIERERREAEAAAKRAESKVSAAPAFAKSTGETAGKPTAEAPKPARRRRASKASEASGTARTSAPTTDGKPKRGRRPKSTKSATNTKSAGTSDSE